MQFKRLARALLREGIEIQQDGPIYKIRRASHDGPAAEILLPDGFPLETKAVKQLAAFASVEHPDGGHVCAACATPDFHPGNVVPVGCVVATTNDMVIPQAIGTDINCGMRLDWIDVTVDQFLSRKKELVDLLRGDLLLGTRDLPMTPATLRAIYEHGAYGWDDEMRKNPMGLMKRASLHHLALDAKCSTWHRGSFMSDTKWVEDRIDDSRDVIRDADLGTVGGGNHFVEIQVVEEILDYGAMQQWGYNLKVGQLAFMTHTGSRSVGKGIGTRWSEIAKERWPKGHKWPEVFALAGEDAFDYMNAMGCAANFAAVNRVVLAAMVRDRFRQIHGEVGSDCFYDVSHNIVTREDDGFLHRKGATPAEVGQPVLIPGSMGHPSFITQGLGNERFLRSASHGAGRSRTRFEMGRKGRPDFDLGLDGVECITLREERLLEEAPAAYKDIAPVVKIQAEQGLVSSVVKMRPLLTFKS